NNIYIASSKNNAFLVSGFRRWNRNGLIIWIIWNRFYTVYPNWIVDILWAYSTGSCRYNNVSYLTNCLTWWAWLFFTRFFRYSNILRSCWTYNAWFVYWCGIYDTVASNDSQSCHGGCTSSRCDFTILWVM